MAQRTQIRLGALSGSFVDIKTEAAHYVTESTAVALTGSDVQDLLGGIAASLNRIHGAASSEPFNNPPGTIRSAANGAAAIKLHADAGSSQTIQLLNDEGTSSSAIDLTATAGGFSVDGVQASNVTVASAADEDDLTISVTGATDSSLHLSSAGTAADALTIATSAGGMDITVAGAAAGEDLDITANSSVNITSSENVADAIVINASAGGIDVTAAGAAGEDIDITNSAGSVNITGAENVADSIKLTGTGVQILASSATHGLKLATGTSGVPITIGNGTSETTVADNLTVDGDMLISGNFTVAGDATVTTLTSSNTVIQDAIIGIGVSGSEGYAPTGVDRGIIFGVGSISAKQPAFYHDASQDAFIIASQTVGPLSSSFPATPAFGDLGELRVATLALDFDGTNSVSSNDTNLTAASGGSITLDANTDIVFDANGGQVTIQDDGADHFLFDSDNTRFRIFDDTSTSDFFDITVAANGATKLATTDNDGSVGHMTLEPKGMLIVDHADKIQLKKGGTIRGTIEHGGDDFIFSSSAGNALVLDSNSGTVILQEAGTQWGHLSNNSALELSSSAGGAIKVDTNAGNVQFLQAGTEFLRVLNASSDAVFQPKQANKDIIFKEDGGNEIARFDSSATSLLIASTNKIQFGDAATFIQQSADGNLRIDGEENVVINASNSVKVSHDFTLFNDGGILGFGADASPDTTITHVTDNALLLNSTREFRFGHADVAISNTTGNAAGLLELKSNGVAFTFPGADGSDGQVLKTNGAGTLTFTSVATPVKSVRIITGSGFPAQGIVSLATADITVGNQQTAMSTAASAGDGLDVFVNGQLLVSGSTTEIAGTPTRDYAITGTNTLKFAFALEADDIVQVINRV